MTMVLQKKDMTEEDIKLQYISLAQYLDESKLNKYPPEEFMKDHDIIINSTGNGTLGRVGIYHNSDNPRDLQVVPDSHVTIIRTINLLSYSFVFYVLKYYQPYMEKLGSGSTNQTELSAGVIKELLFPLPPPLLNKSVLSPKSKNSCLWWTAMNRHGPSWKTSTAVSPKI